MQSFESRVSGVANRREIEIQIRQEGINTISSATVQYIPLQKFFAPNSDKAKRFFMKLFMRYLLSDNPIDRLLIFFPHFTIHAVFIDQFVMRALFHNYTFVDNDNIVRVGNAR